MKKRDNPAKIPNGPEGYMNWDARTTPLASAVQETLDAFVAPRVRDRLLSDALRASGLSELPDSPEDLRWFVTGPLQHCTKEALGQELADSITTELARLVNSAFRQPAAASLAPTKRPPPLVPRKHTPPRSTAPPATRRSLSPSQRVRSDRSEPSSAALAHSFIRRQEPTTGPAAPLVSPSEYFRNVAAGAGVGADTDARSASGRQPRVLAATNDASLTRALATWFDGRAEVEIVRSVFTLVSDVQDPAEAPLLIVLDMASPSIRPEALAALADDLADIRVVVVRSTPQGERRLITVSPSVKNWTTFRDATEVDEIASGCAGLLG